MFDTPSSIKKPHLLANHIYKDTFVVSRNSDFIKSNNCSEIIDFISNVEPRNGSHKQASENCRKDGDFIESRAGRRTDLEAATRDVPKARE